MTTVARYIIVLDRMDDDEAVGHDGHWPENDKEGMTQVASELQYAMEQEGQPAGFFRVVARTEFTHEGDKLAYEAEEEDAHRMAMVALEDTRAY